MRVIDCCLFPGGEHSFSSHIGYVFGAFWSGFLCVVVSGSDILDILDKVEHEWTGVHGLT